MSQTRHRAVIENLEDLSFEFGRRIGGVGRGEAAKNSPRLPRREDSGPSRSANLITAGPMREIV